MNRISSNPFLTPALLRQSADLRVNLQRASQEMTTGKLTDPGQVLRGDFTTIASTDHALARLNAFSAATTELSLVAETMQRSLAVISDAAIELATNLLRTTSGANETQLSAIAATGLRDFTTAVAVLNTRISEKSIFRGDNPDQTALSDTETILSALEAAIAGAISVSDINDQIDSWFAGTTGFQMFYNGGNSRAALNIAPGETASLPVTALDPAIRETLAGLAKVALLERGLLTGNHDARSELAIQAGNDLFNTSEKRSILSGRIGSTEQQLLQAKTRNAAEKSALSISRTSMTEADPYETAIRLQDLESRLDAFYTITARLSQLSLTGYLR